ncbi:MAG: hypothetical protein RLZZ74_1080 [Cyanobacteriota bacterium]|jgi:hypothetical protein
MTWKGKHPKIELIQTNYPTGVRLTKSEMNEIESLIQRLPHLPNWFVDICPASGWVWIFYFLEFPYQKKTYLFPSKYYFR